MKVLFAAAVFFFTCIHSLRAQDSSHKMELSDTTITFTKCEVEAEYPGGQKAWLRFLVKNLRYPEPAVKGNIQGTIWVQFIVDRNGNVSNVRPIDDGRQVRGGLQEEAVRLISASGKWTPGMQNGVAVRSYKKMPIVFALSN